MTMAVRGVRGAITVETDTADDIYQGTRKLMAEIIRANSLRAEDVVSVLLTMTQDLTADFPAKAVRSLPDWEWVPLMCAVEVAVPGGMTRCIRMLLHVNTSRTQKEMVHVYLGSAVNLRPDMVRKQQENQPISPVDEP